ncbi:MAG TPA: hypothetical protein VF046_07195 [Gemmatimonadales bacterium]
MPSVEEGTITPGALLPEMQLVSAATGVPVDLHSVRGPRALVAIHSVGCAACRDYVRERLARAAREVAEWGGRLCVIVPGRRGDASDFAETTTDALEVLVDASGAFAHRRAAVVVTDQWGEVHSAVDAADGHELPDPQQLVVSIRFLATQCSECEVPEGEWRSIR